MNEASFKMEDICAIIKECGKSGVKRFKYKDIELDFDGPPSQPDQTPVYSPEQLEIANSQTREANKEEATLKQAEELDQLLIEDPIGYFEAFRQGKIDE
jgi:hypothetical protein